MTTIIAIIIGTVGALIAVAFMRALTARPLTGYWPHQHKESKRVYDYLTKNT